MRVAFTSQPWATPYPPSESVAIWSHEVAAEAAPQEAATVWGRKSSVDEPDEELHAGVRYRTVYGRGDYRLLQALEALKGLRPRLRPLFATRPFHFFYHRELVAAIAAERPAIVHVHNFSQLLGPLRRSLPDARLVLHMHCEWLNRLDPRLIAPRVAIADAIVGCSDYIRDRAAEAFPRTDTLFKTLYNGVSPALFGLPAPGEAPPVVLLALGRISPERGTHLLFAAFDRLIRAGHDAELHIVGEPATPPDDMLWRIQSEPRLTAARAFGRDRAYLDRIMGLVGTSARARLHLHGSVEHHAVHEFLQHAHVVVSPTVVPEPFGMPNAEGMAAGRAVVAADGGGVPEYVVNERTGLLFRRGDVDDLTSVLERVVADGELRMRLGESGRRRAQEFAWPVIADQTRALHRLLVQGT